MLQQTQQDSERTNEPEEQEPNEPGWNFAVVFWGVFFIALLAVGVSLLYLPR